jgi:hypothetical protein
VSRNYIVLRASPDWLNFKLEETRAFCRRFKLPDNLIIDFAESWQRTFGMSYGEIRQEIKAITLSTIAATRDCRLAGVGELESPADDDLFVFTDDDDWTAPHLFEALRSAAPLEDGFVWGSIFLGRYLVDAPGIGEVRGVAAGSPALQKRALQNFLYTNNYAVTGRAVRRLGTGQIFEHDGAQQAMAAGDFAPAMVRSYLSATNKHPWSTMAIMHNSRSPGFLDRLEAMLIAYARALDEVAVDADTRWVIPYLDRMKALTRQVLASRR